MRQGFATEAAAAARDYSFGHLGLRRLMALIDPKNVRSIGVAEKIGLQPEKDIVFRGKAVRVFAMQSLSRGEDP